MREAITLEALVYECDDAPAKDAPWDRAQRLELRWFGRDESERELSAVWMKLAAMRERDEALEQIVLDATVPGFDEPPSMALRFDEPPEPPRATAANPRAYRGTKHKPPRSARPEPVDVRPHLLARGRREPTLAARVLPEDFAPLARALELHDHPELTAALVGVYLEDPARAVGWWSHVLGHAPERRLLVAQIVGASGIAKLDPIDPSIAATIAPLEPAQIWTCYRMLARGATSAYVISGLDLGAITVAGELPAGRDDVTALVESTLERLGDAMSEDSGAPFWRTQLWRLCGEVDQRRDTLPDSLVDLLASDAFRTLAPPAAFWAIRLANTGFPHISGLVALAAARPAEYQRKLVEDLGDAYWWIADDNDGGDVRAAIVECTDVAIRLARAPFGTKSVVGALMIELPLAEAPDASWLALEAACARDNDVRLLIGGFARLRRDARVLLDETFTLAPAALIQTAEALASISAEAGRDVLVAHAKSPLARPLDALSIEQLVALVRPFSPASIRRALRDHLDGERVLSPAQLAGHRERILADIPIARLASIRHDVGIVLASAVKLDRVDGPNARHALAMLRNVDVHRRQLRRMLAATFAGDRDWRTRHPLTRAWFAKHPRIDPAALLGAFVLDAVSLELDPLEALKLGTYVGTCLGRGGRLEFSAAAVVLDVNKLVAYARDSRGSVIGRQLLAVSETDELVCFAVYGASRTELEPRFRAFDAAFAARLGIPIATGEYDVATILAHDWWDDSAWRP